MVITTQEVTYMDRYGIIHKKIIYSDSSANAAKQITDIQSDVTVKGVRQLNDPDDVLHNYGSLSVSTP